MSGRQIEWGDPQPWGRDGVMYPGTVEGLLVAQVIKAGDGRWWANMLLSPLPGYLDRLSDTTKVSERQAKATAQRVLNALTKILTGEK